jgi:hypothetical protein
MGKQYLLIKVKVIDNQHESLQKFIPVDARVAELICLNPSRLISEQELERRIMDMFAIRTIKEAKQILLDTRRTENGVSELQKESKKD